MTPTHVTMYVAIGAVRPSDLVFDGEQWVKHDGVVYSGMRETITHDGLTATPLHNVWLSNNERVMFGEAKANGWPLWRGIGVPTTGEP
jgi:DNA polymerase